MNSLIGRGRFSAFIISINTSVIVFSSFFIGVYLLFLIQCEPELCHGLFGGIAAIAFFNTTNECRPLFHENHVFETAKTVPTRLYELTEKENASVSSAAHFVLPRLK